MQRTIPSYPAYVADSDGCISRGWRKLTPRDNGHGYMRVTVSMNNKPKTVYVHRLVCEAFHGPAPDSHECRHLNGVRDDNRPENLAWATKATNEADKDRHGTRMKGERMRHARLTEEIVLAAREHARNKGDVAAFAAEHGIPQKTMQDAVFGRRWGWLPGAVEPFHTRRRFTDDQVREIRRRAVVGETQLELAAAYGCTGGAIGAITRRESYGHVD